MALINGMHIDSNSGVSIRRLRSYYTYTNENCIDVTGQTIESYLDGLHVTPYKNTNPNFISEINDEAVMLTLSGNTIGNWFESYVNSIATTGYTGYIDSPIEERIINDSTSNVYYKLIHTTTGETTNTPSWAIFNQTTEELWEPGVEYFYSEVDECGVFTGRKIVVLIDINEFSPTVGSFKYVEKCKDEISVITIDTININNITSNSAIVETIIVNGDNIIERGVCYSNYSNPTISDMKVDGDSTDEYTVNLLDLIGDTKYYIRAYAINNDGIWYGNELNFNTL